MKALLISDVWPNNMALGRYATYLKGEGYEVHHRCYNPDIVVASWNFEKSSGQTHLWNGAEVIEGGPAINPKKHLPPNIESLPVDYDFLGIDYGLERLTIGCPRACPWCKVSEIWGRKVKAHHGLEYIPEDFTRMMVMDDNLLAYRNCLKLLEKMRERGLEYTFQSGLDARFVTDKKAEALKALKIRSRKFNAGYLYIAFDNTKDERQIERGIRILREHKIRLVVYALGGYPNGDEFDDLFYRCEKLIEWGVDPYIMPFKKANRKIRQLDRCIDTRTYRRKGLRKAWEEYHAK